MDQKTRKAAEEMMAYLAVSPHALPRRRYDGFCA